MKIHTAAALLAASTLLPAIAAAAGNSYAVTLTPSTSTLTYSLGVSAPFTGNLIGTYSATNTAGTRTKPAGLFSPGPGPTENLPVTVSGTGSANGSGGTPAAPIHPTGAFVLTLDTAGGVASAYALNTNLLGGATTSVAATVGLMYQSFKTANPTCTLPSLGTVTLPLGNATVTALTGQQIGGPAEGTLTPTATANRYAFSIPMTLDVTTSVTFNGNPVPAPTQQTPVVLSGTATISGSNVSITSTIDLSNTQTIPGPTVLDPLPYDDLPLCTGSHVVINLKLTSTGINLMSSAALAAAGGPTFNPADIDRSGEVNANDISAYINVWYGDIVRGTTGGDFDRDGETNANDLSAYINAWFRAL